MLIHDGHFFAFNANVTRIANESISAAMVWYIGKTLIRLGSHDHSSLKKAAGIPLRLSRIPAFPVG